MSERRTKAPATIGASRLFFVVCVPGLACASLAGCASSFPPVDLRAAKAYLDAGQRSGVVLHEDTIVWTEPGEKSLRAVVRRHGARLVTDLQWTRTVRGASPADYERIRSFFDDARRVLLRAVPLKRGETK